MSPFYPAPAGDSLPAIEHAPDIVFGLFIGIMLTASMYLFFIWLVLRDRGQIFLMFLLLCLGINMASTNDSILFLLGLRGDYMAGVLQSYSMILAYIFGIFFTLYFLEIDAIAPRAKPVFHGLLTVLVVLFAIAIIDQRNARFVLPIVGALSLSAALGAGLFAFWRGLNGSLSHIAAFSFFLLGGIAESLYDLGYLDSEITAKNLTYAGFSFATMVFAIVIAGQFSARQEEKERALHLSNERFALAARGSNEGLFDWNRLTSEVYFSEQFRKILGIGIESNLRGLREWARVIQPADRRNLFAALRKFRDSTGVSAISVEYRIMSGQGKWRWIHTRAVATRDPHTRRVTRFVGSIGDVTQRKRSEVELRASEARFRSITEAHPVPVLIVRLQDGGILYASPGAEALLGLPGGLLTSHRLERFLPRASERKEIIGEITSGHDVNLKEIMLSRGDGESLPAALSARRINYQNEAAIVIGLYDLTEQKKAQKQIADQQEALQQSEKMAALGGLLAGVAHELNNPLSVVMGQTSLLMEAPQGEDKTKNRAEKIFKAADRCSRIVKSFLALARRKPPERKDVDLNTIIQNSLELLGYQFRNENVELTLDLAADLPPVVGDEAQMTQVFTNLALNAAQAMHEWKGAHKLTISSRVEGENVCVRVVDTGPGIPPELRNKVFEPFFTTKGGTGGTGVGLSLCLNIVEGHGGRLHLEETTGGGATFLISLPISAGVRSLEGESVPSREKTASNRKLRLLLVDDEVELAQTLADLLEPLGHDIDLAANGAIAYEKIEKKGFDVIISDLRMPVLDGPGLYALLAEKKPEYTKKIIYVTGDTLSTNVHEFLSQTPVPVIEKPYRLADVQDALVKLLKES